MTTHNPTTQTAVALLCVVLSLGWLHAAERHRVQKATVTITCPLTVGGSFEARTTALTGELALLPETTDGVRGTLSVDLRLLETGIGLRDRHLRQNYLEVDKRPEFSVATLQQIRIANWDGTSSFRGILTLHGQQQEIAGTATVKRERGAFQVEAVFPLRISDFQIAEPTYLGVGVSDNIEVRVRMSAVPMGSSSLNRGQYERSRPDPVPLRVVY